MATKKALHTREAILEAARFIVQKEGVDALSMDHLAQVAHMSKGAVTYHFKSKRELNRALLEDYAEHLRSGLKSHEDNYIGGPEDTLVPAYADWFRDFDRSSHGWAQLGVHLLSQQVKDPELVRPVREWYAEVARRAEAFPKERQPRVLTAVMALEGLFFVHKFGLDALSEEQKQEILSFLTGELCPSAAARKDS